MSVDQQHQSFGMLPVHKTSKETLRVEGSRAFLYVRVLLFAALLGLVLYDTIKVRQLENELAALKSVVQDVNFRRKYQSTYEDDTEPSNLIYSPKPDDFDADYDYDHVSDEDDELGEDLQDESEILANILYGGNYTKEGTETSRSRRSVRDDIYFRIDNVKPVGGDGVNSPIPVRTEGYKSPAYRRRPGNVQVEPQVQARTSRVMNTDDPSKAFRRLVTNAELKTLEQQGRVQAPDDVFKRRKNLEHPGNRHARNRSRFPAVHYSGDTSKYVYGQHGNYNGNGHLYHPSGKFVDWVEKEWVERLHMDAHFDLSDGVFRVKQPGLYFIYVQIYYIDEHDSSGYVVLKNEEQILHCTTMTHSSLPINKTNTCFTAGAEYLDENDEIIIRDRHQHYSVFQEGKSFFGAIKL